MSLLGIKKHCNKIIKKVSHPLILRYCGTITHVCTVEPVAALTFDDGPHPVYTPSLLKILEIYNARATFFMVGEAAQRQQEIVKMVAQAGHAIGVHSWDHPSFAEIDSGERRRQLHACERVLGFSGEKLFRPPWGVQSAASRLDALLLGYKVVTWSASAGDWLDLTPREMIKRLMISVRPGNIILLHDAIYKSRLANPQFDRSAMLDALDAVLRKKSKEICFVTVPELLRYGRPILQKGFCA